MTTDIQVTNISVKEGRKQNASRELVINIFGAVGSDKEEFDKICGIVVNSHGTMCVVESKNSRLQLIGTSIWRKTMSEKDIKRNLSPLKTNTYEHM